MALKGECGPFGPTQHGYHEYLLSRRSAALQISLSPKTYPRCQQAPSPHFPYAYPVQDCRGLCCSWLCDAGRAKENRQKQYGTISKSWTTHALVSMIDKWHVSSWSDGNAAAITVVLFDFRKAFNLINHNILLCKLLDTIFQTTSYAGLLTFY